MEQNYNREILNNKNEQEYQEDNKNINEDIIENEQIEEVEGEGEDDDDRLTYTLITLDLGNLIHIFEDNSISFVDMLLLTKEDLIELQLEIFQRNRILNFSKLFTKYAKNYSIQEISDFFTFNKQFIFNSIIYDKVSNSNISHEFQNELNNTGINNNDNNNMVFESNNNNQEINYLNTEPNNKNNINNNNYLLAQKSKTNTYKNNIKNNNNQFFMPKTKETPISSQNINGASNSKLIPKNLLISKDNTNLNKKRIGINNNININNDNKDKVRNKIMDIVQKKKIGQSNLDKNINKGININKKGKMIHKEINKNDEFQKIIEKIGILESSEMNYDLYTRLNLIKNYINMKGDKMSSEDLINIDNDIQTMMNSININKMLKK